WVPDPAHEAMRDLVRARLAAVRNVREARQQLSGFLLRNGYHHHRGAWTLLRRRWMADLKLDQPLHYIVMQDCIAAVEASEQRRSVWLNRSVTLPGRRRSGYFADIANSRELEKQKTGVAPPTAREGQSVAGRRP